MAPDNENREQDYEVLDDEPPRGGPARQQPPKGKITQKSAKMIWFICIAVSLLGVAAVVIDVVLDPLQRRVAPPDNGRIAPRPNQGRPVRPQQQLSEKEKLARSYGLGAYEQGQKIIASRAYDFVRLAVNEARESAELALQEDNRSDGYLWLDAWKKWYHASYALELFLHKWPFEMVNLPVANKYDQYDAFTDLSEEILQSEEAQQQFASYVLHLGMQGEVSDIERRIRDIAKAATVRSQSEELQPAKDKLKAAQDDRTFAEEDLTYVDRDPRGEDEPAPYME